MVGRIRAGTGDRAGRLALLTAVVAAHLLLILWLVARTPIVPILPARGPTLIAIASLSEEGVEVELSRPAQQKSTAARAPLPPPLIAMPSPIPAASDAVATNDAAASGGGGCQLAGNVAAAILADPSAMAELAALPPGVRSDADAVMIWNGGWSGQGPATGPSVAAPIGERATGLRSLIEQTVAAASAQCRAVALTGPVFVPIAEVGRTTMLAIGSGVWRWDDLLLAPNCSMSGAALCGSSPTP